MFAPTKNATRGASDIHARIATKWNLAEDSGCFTWAAATGTSGYGVIKVNGRQMLAHRAVYESTVGPIPDGMYIDHLCRNTLCVNPDHLEPVTPGENVRRGASSFAFTGKCRKGLHEISGDADVYVASVGSRLCRRCNLAWHAQRKAAAS